MRHFNMTVVERREPFTGHFETHPFEAAWASEAIFFIRIEELAPGAAISGTVQISADGIHWIDDDVLFGPFAGVGNYAVKAREFGGWLRLQGTISGDEPITKLTIQLALKE